MRKFSIGILIIIIMVSIIGCETKKENQVINNTDQKQANSTSTPAAQSLQPSKSVVKDYADINIFWNDFRIDLLNEDIIELEKFVQFPLDTRGPLDFHPTIKIEESRFKDMLKVYLNQPDYTAIETERDYIIKTKELIFSNVKISEKSIRVGDMIFTLINNCWKLTFAYLSEDSYKNLGINIE